jgi:hypothetical protein
MVLKFIINFFSILTSSNEKTQNYKVVDLIEGYNFYIKFIFIRHRMKEFSNILSSQATPGDVTEQYCHASVSDVTAFSTSGTPSNTVDFVAPMHVARQRYLVAPTPLRDQKG